MKRYKVKVLITAEKVQEVFIPDELGVGRARKDAKEEVQWLLKKIGLEKIRLIATEAKMDEEAEAN